MKQSLFILAALISITIAEAQEKAKQEGAHQAEYNSRQNKPPGLVRTSESLYDAADVSASNEALPATDSSTTEQNTMVPVTGGQSDVDGTGNKATATLNVAGSPVPGTSNASRKSVVTKTTNSKSKEDSPGKKSKKGKRK